MPSGREDLVKLSHASLSVLMIPLADFEETAVPDVAELVDLLQPVGEVTIKFLPSFQFTNSKLPLLIREESVSTTELSVELLSGEELSSPSLQAARAATDEDIIIAMKSARSLFLFLIVAIITTFG